MQIAKRMSSTSTNLMDYSSKFVFILLGNLFCSIAFNGFFVPNHLLSGGVGGIAIMIHFLTNLPIGLIIFLINIPIFIIGSKIIDKKFTTYSFISMLTLSFLLELTRGIDQLIMMDDILLAAIFGGILNGLGMGLMFRNRTSQGGLDIIAAIFKKKYNINIGTGLMGVNTIIIASSSALFGLKPAMYTLIALYTAYKIVDKVQEGLDTKKNVIIISDKSQELGEAIQKKLHRGVTFLKGEGGYTKNNKNVIYCIVTSTQVGKLKEIVEEVDPNAFMTINNIQEVKGKGFKSVGI
ncbi:YitT family protein [Caloranaerobacter ferrireducens]|uniref:YitT family protein n=1 Tax=Caloranaerobacter ferrireducens TaxID=1323370 RepID=UPI000A8312DA|nr:YitT family protein [Caloranaerobacter ferrireducens]